MLVKFEMSKIMGNVKNALLIFKIYYNRCWCL